MTKAIMVLNRKHEDPSSSNEIVCVLRYQKQHFINKGIRAQPLATEFRWNGNRIPIPRGTSCLFIQKMLKSTF